MPPGDLIPFSQAFALPGAGDVVCEKYRIERLLAEGGMGIVYEATHLQLDEKVAIKFLRAEFMGPQAGELPGRFLREARLSSKIKSEHVVRVHDVGSTDAGGPFIVMEYLTGEDLDQIVSHQGVLPIQQAIDFVLQACEALAEAHAIGIVHRDLKPANLFLTHRADDSPCVKVLDFGISKFKEGAGNTRDFGMTKTHAVMGSPSYMSPEQMRSSKDVDARADIWAIGIILYELLAGAVPFDGDSMPQICAAILEEIPKSICVMRPEITMELEAIITRCLAKNPDDRFANVADLAQALAPWGSPAALASAERIARVLHVSGPRDIVEAAPVPLTKPIFVPPPATPLPPPGDENAGRRVVHAPILRELDAPGSADASGAEIAWAGLEMVNPRIKQRRRNIFATVAACVVLVGIGAGAAVFVEHRRMMPVETTAAVVHTKLPQPTLSVLPSELPPPPPSAMPVAVAITQNASAQPPEPVVSSAPKTSKPAPKHTASHASTSHPASPPATQSDPAPELPADMWSERK